MQSQLILSLILEDFNIDDEMMRINKALLDEDSPSINLVVDKLDKEDTDDIADQISNDINNILDVDVLIDKLDDIEDDSAEYIDVHVKNTPLKAEVKSDNEIYLKVHKDKNDMRLNLNDKSNDNDVQLNLNDKSNNIDNDEDALLLYLNEKPINPKDNNLSVNVNDNNIDNDTITLNVNDRNSNPEEEGTISLRLTDKVNTDDNSIPSEPGALKVTLKEKVKDGDTVEVKLTNLDNEPEDKLSQFIKKRDELISSGDPNLQLSTCLKIIIQLKKSLEKLISYIPNENILVKTKYLIGNMLDNILENSDNLLRDEKKLHDVIYKIFDMLMSINKYIVKKYYDLEDKLSDTVKEDEDEGITNQLNKVEENHQEQERTNSDNNSSNINNNGTNNFNDQNNNQTTDNNSDIKTTKRPNINRIKI